MTVLTLHFCMYFIYMILCALTHNAQCRHFYWRRSLSNWKLQRAQFLIIDLILSFFLCFSYWRYNDDFRFLFLTLSQQFFFRAVYNFKSFESIHWPFVRLFIISFCLNLSDRHLWLAWILNMQHSYSRRVSFVSISQWMFQVAFHWLDFMNLA